MSGRAVYMITNKVNNKRYIGRSKDPRRRFARHCNRRESLISKSILKHGKENFDFEILGWYEDSIKEEIEMIKFYDSLVPNGYNIRHGGEDPPTHIGEDNPNSTLVSEQVNKVQHDLVHSHHMTPGAIRDKHSITVDQYRHINEGGSWRKEGLTYPLRPSENEINSQKADRVIHLLKTTSMTQKEIGYQVGWKRSTVTMINIGNNHFRENEAYPIR